MVKPPATREPCGLSPRSTRDQLSQGFPVGFVYRADERFLPRYRPKVPHGTPPAALRVRMKTGVRTPPQLASRGTVADTISDGSARSPVTTQQPAGEGQQTEGVPPRKSIRGARISTATGMIPSHRPPQNANFAPAWECTAKPGNAAHH